MKTIKLGSYGLFSTWKFQIILKEQKTSIQMLRWKFHQEREWENWYHVKYEMNDKTNELEVTISSVFVYLNFYSICSLHTDTGTSNLVL